jgi:hypothetical protein
MRACLALQIEPRRTPFAAFKRPESACVYGRVLDKGFPSIACEPRLCWCVPGKHASTAVCVHWLSLNAAPLHTCQE